jgi:hypothetical protein
MQAPATLYILRIYYRGWPNALLKAAGCRREPKLKQSEWPMLKLEIPLKVGESAYKKQQARMCKRPNLDPKKLASLEAWCVEPAKILLVNWAGRNRDEPIMVDSVEMQRGEIQDWLNWKARKDTHVARITMWAAIAAAILAIPSFLAFWR